jgi:hypothetical protein
MQNKLTTDELGLTAEVGIVCRRERTALETKERGKQKKTWIYLQVPIAGASYGELEILYMSGGFVGRRSHLETVSFYFMKSYVVSSVCTPTR